MSERTFRDRFVFYLLVVVVVFTVTWVHSEKYRFHPVVYFLLVAGSLSLSYRMYDYALKPSDD